MNLPPELRAILHITNSDAELQRKVLPFIDLDIFEIEWEPIFAQEFDCGHSAAVRWMFAIWVGEVRHKDPMPQSYYMDAAIATAVLEGLRIAWTIDP